MRAAAQLLAEAGNRDDADLVAVFFAEQRHGAGRDGLIERHDVGLDRMLRRICSFTSRSTSSISARSMRRVMREIETQPRRLHDAARLLDVRAQHLPQRGVQQCVAV